MGDIMKDKASGKAKEVAGKLTGNKKLEIKGKIQHAAGETRQKSKHIIDEISRKVG